MRTKTVLAAGALVGAAGAALGGRRRLKSTIASWSTNLDSCAGDPEGMPNGDDVEVTTADGAVLRGVDCGQGPSGPSRRRSDKSGEHSGPAILGSSTQVQGPTVLLAHCWTGTRCNWAPVACRLVDAGFRVVAFDQRGHGASDRGTADYAPETLGHDIATIIEALDLRDVVLAGHSMGGLASMAFAAFHQDLAAERVRSMVLVATLASPPLPPHVPQTRLDLAPALPLLERSMRHPDYGLLGMLQVFGRAPARSQLEAARRGFLGTDSVTRGQAVTMMMSFDLRPVLPDITVPTRVIAGRKDQLTWPHTNQAVADLIPNATIEFLDDRGHMLPWEAPDVVTETIVQAAKDGTTA